MKTSTIILYIIVLIIIIYFAYRAYNTYRIGKGLPALPSLPGLPPVDVAPVGGTLPASFAAQYCGTQPQLIATSYYSENDKYYKTDRVIGDVNSLPLITEISKNDYTLAFNASKTPCS